MAEEMGMPEGMTEEQIDAMEDAAGTAAEEAYTAAIEGGADPSAAASAAASADGRGGGLQQTCIGAVGRQGGCGGAREALYQGTHRPRTPRQGSDGDRYRDPGQGRGRMRGSLGRIRRFSRPRKAARGSSNFAQWEFAWYDGELRGALQVRAGDPWGI